jgi:hypothetical protein
MALETQILACLSTSHIDEQTARELDVLVQYPLPIAARDNPAIWQGEIVAERWQECGWFVWVGSTGRDAMPSSLRACFALAEAAGSNWIQFDRDCAPIAELPVYDW